LVDNIAVWVDDGTNIGPVPDPDENGTLLLDGGFETFQIGQSGSPWQQEEDISTQSVTRVSGRSVEGQWSARLIGDEADFLYQTVFISPNITDLGVHFWATISTTEGLPGYDYFCASFVENDPLGAPSDLLDDPEKLLVDMGCFDAFYADDYEGYWFEVDLSLEPEEVALLADQGTVDLLFEMYNWDSGTTNGPLGGNRSAVWIDDVQVYVTGDGGGAYLDGSEPNDTPISATTIFCGESNTLSDRYIGDFFSGGDDEDWYRLENVPAGTLEIDIKARTKIPPSQLDSIVGLYQDGDFQSPVARTTMMMESARTPILCIPIQFPTRPTIFGWAPIRGRVAPTTIMI
jgi:hypothetical protein